MGSEVEMVELSNVNKFLVGKKLILYRERDKFL